MEGYENDGIIDDVRVIVGIRIGEFENEFEYEICLAFDKDGVSLKKEKGKTDSTN